MATPEPQGGILPEPGESALFLVLRLRDRARQDRAVAKAVARVPARTRKLVKLEPRGRLASVVGFGPELWDQLSPGSRPRAFRPFRPMKGDGGRAPATGGDLLVHIVARRPDLCFELAMQLRRDLGDLVDVHEEVHGFRYLDARDLTGFIDGTENPKGRARAGVALIGSEDPAFAGGSLVFTQRYVHELESWRRLAVHEQERIIGRRKRDSRELSSRTRPSSAHISRTVILEDDEELEIVRHSFPYGTTSEHGLFFIAYTRDLAIPEKMLSRMIGTVGDGLHDRLMDFTRAVSGATFFAPSLRALRSFA